jgi:serine/threonine-protein kinase CTR1
MESLKSIHPDDSSIQAILVDRRIDFELGMLEGYAASLLSSATDAKDVVNQLAKLVSSRMGWEFCYKDPQYILFLIWPL